MVSYKLTPILSLSNTSHRCHFPLATSNGSIGLQTQGRKGSLSLSSCLVKIALGFVSANYTMVHPSITKVIQRQHIHKPLFTISGDGLNADQGYLLLLGAKDRHQILL